MSNVAVQFDHVWKKFRKGESYDSLRDLIPAAARRLFSGNHRDELRNKEFWALKDVSFEVKHGEALGIIGSNGAGKSTTLKLLSRILRPNQGSIRVIGRLSALIEVGAGFHPDLTGRENIYLNAAILGMNRSQVDQRFDEIVAFSGLEDFIDTPVKRYSSGMYARLGFSVAVHVNPEVLLVDEVLSVGDMIFQEKCVQRMLSFAERGTTVIFVSHNLAAVKRLCARTVLLSKGEMVSTGPTDGVLVQYVQSVGSSRKAAADDLPLSNVRLATERHGAADLFSPGQRASLTFTVKADVPIADCILGFIIRRATDGLQVADYNLQMDSIRRSSDDVKDLECSLTFDVNLLRGAYTILLHLFHRPTVKYLAWVEPAAFFTVQESMSWSGLAHLNPVLDALASSQK